MNKIMILLFTLLLTGCNIEDNVEDVIEDVIEAKNDYVVSKEDSVIYLDVLSNDTDTYNETPIKIVSVKSHHGNVVIAKEKIKFTPNPNYNGEALVTYFISDGITKDNAVVRINIQPVDDDPVLKKDYTTAGYNQSVIIDCLSNDLDVDSVLSISSLGTPSNGTAEVVDGEVKYQPDKDFYGQDSFTYTVMSNQEEFTSTITIEVEVPLEIRQFLCEGKTYTKEYSDEYGVDIIDHYGKPDVVCQKGIYTWSSKDETNEYVEFIVNGTIYEFEFIEIVIQDEPFDLLDGESLHYIGTITNNTVLASAMLPEGIPWIRARWKDTEGKIHTHDISFRDGRGNE
jgi:hypothetical protein